MILGAFGDSFLFGSDLDDCVNNRPSNQTYPAIIAKKLNKSYKCFAEPGRGNHFILNTILDNIDTNIFYIINWTWIDRFDYLDASNNTWQTVRPSLDNEKIDKFYYKTFHSELRDKQITLGQIYQAISVLEQNNCKYLMTFMDNLIFDTTWHCTPGIKLLQEKIKNSCKTFDKQNFLDWSKSNSYEISDKWHPLEKAHQKAAKYWLPTVSQLLNTSSKEDYLHAFI